jgi:hypothetical protein
MVWASAAIVLCVGCQSASSSAPDAKPLGDGGTPPATINCNPGELLCNNGHLWSCTLSGHDANHVLDCAGQGTTTNPASCSTSACPNGATACCTRQDSTCSYSLTSPFALQGDTCTPPTLTEMPTCGKLAFNLVEIPQPAPNVCSSDITEVIVSLDRATHTPGSTFALASGDSVLYVAVQGGVSTSCSGWTGNVHWISDVPAWRVDFDLTCTTGTLHLVGSFHGTL